MASINKSMSIVVSFDHGDFINVDAVFQSLNYARINEDHMTYDHYKAWDANHNDLETGNWRWLGVGFFFKADNIEKAQEILDNLTNKYIPEFFKEAEPEIEVPF